MSIRACFLALTLVAGAALADQLGAGVGVRLLATQVAGADVSLRVFFPSDDRSAATSFGRDVCHWSETPT